MRTGTFKDKGHYSRKAVFYAYAMVTLVPWLLVMGMIKLGMALERPIVKYGHKLRKWANPCLYYTKIRDEQDWPPRKDGKDW